KTRGRGKAAARASPPYARRSRPAGTPALRLRKQLPEPVFGQIKQARGFRQFLLRGVEKVANEWGLVRLAHNILKLAQGRTPSLAALATGIRHVNRHRKPRKDGKPPLALRITSRQD